MSVVYWKMVNGLTYSYLPYGSGLTSISGIGTGNGSAFTSASMGINAPALGPAGASPAVPSPSVPPNSSLFPKWIMPNYMSQQLQYMFLPRMAKSKGDKIPKSVKCEVCGITLNSEQQAKQHYNGKNHLKKMKQQGIPLPGEEEGQKIIREHVPKSSPSPSETMPAISSSPSPIGASGALPSGEEMGQKLDPVSQAVYDNMMGKLPTKKRKIEIPCAVCDLIFNSELQADQHFRGVKHVKRLKMVEDLNKSLQGNEGQNSSLVNPDISGENTEPAQCFYCSFCNMSLNSLELFEEHREGEVHKKNVEKKRGLEEVPGQVSGMFYCKVCDISVPKAARLQQHMSSLAHQDRAAGRIPKSSASSVSSPPPSSSSSSSSPSSTTQAVSTA